MNENKHLREEKTKKAELELRKSGKARGKQSSGMWGRHTMMQKNHPLEVFVKKVKQKRTFKRAIALLSVVVILVTFNSTKFMADTLEHVADCGYDYDHQHGPECYDASGELVCQLHVHTDACYQTRPVSEPVEATVEAPVEEAAELADLPVEEDASASVEEAVSASVGDTVSEQVEETVEEVEIELDEEAEEAEDESQFYDEEVPETEPEAVEPEHIDDEAAPETQLLFYVGDQYPFFLSDVLSACDVDVPLAEVVEIGQVLSADDAPQTLSFERIEDDYAIYTAEDCEDQELAIITETDLVTVRLIEAVVPQWVKEQAEKQTEEQTGEDEQTAVTEEQPAEEEVVAETVEADNTIEEISAAEEPAVIEESIVTEADIATEDAEEPVQSEEAEKVEDDTVTEDVEEPIKPEEVEEVEEAVTASETEETEMIEDAGEAVETEEPEDSEESDVTEKSAETEEPKDDEASAGREESENGEESAGAEELEDDKESAGAEESEDGEKPVETEEPENDEESAETEESEDDKESAEAEESEDGEKPAETEEAEDGEEANVSDNHSLIIDLSQVESYPLSLNAMLAHFQPVDVAPAETTSTETDPAEAEADDALTEDTEVESEAVEADVNEVEFELGEEPEAAGSVESMEPVEDTSAQPVLAYDNMLLVIEPSEDDYLITPIASFDRADIVVDDTWTILLLNSSVEDAVASMPAQSFEGETDYVSVKVEAPEGAFPAGTTMSLADIDDEDTLTGIGDAVAGEDFVEVQRVHAVDITFRDIDGNEIEPLIPISVVMSIRETEADEDTVVVHMDDEGNAEVVPDVVSATEETDEAIVEAQPVDAPVESVSFESDAFSVYAVVVTKKLETKFITAGDETYKITVTYTEDAVIPEGAALDVREIEGDEAEEYLTQAGNAVEDGRQIKLARFFDIRIMDGEAEVQPAAPVMVTAELVNDEAINLTAAEPCAVHFTDEEPELVKANETDDAVSFKAEGFSVWGVVYTVDFHWEVKGKVYDFSIPGGGYVSLSKLVDILGIADDGEQDDSDDSTQPQEAEAEDAAALSLDDVKVSEAAKQFVANVESVVFSNPGLVWVGAVQEAATVGELKEVHGLAIEYSENLTDEQIAEINAQTVEAGDWALISLFPFDTEESLTITMKDGRQYIVRVTDKQVTDIYEAKYLNGKAYALVIDGSNLHALLTPEVLDYRRLKAKPVDNPNMLDKTTTPLWYFEQVGETWRNQFYISSGGKYLNISYEGDGSVSVSNTPQAINVHLQNGKIWLTDNYWNGVNLYGGRIDWGFGPYGGYQYWTYNWNELFSLYEISEAVYPRSIDVDIVGDGSITLTECYEEWTPNFYTHEETITTYSSRSVNLSVRYGSNLNNQEIVAIPGSGYEFDHWEVNDVKQNGEAFSTAIIPAGAYEVNQHDKLTVVFKKSTSSSSGEEINFDQVIQEWVDKKTNDQPVVDKTAEVYDYENRIYKIDINASSELYAVAQNLVLDFVTDVSGSMQFPSKMEPVATFSSANDLKDQLDLVCSNNHYGYLPDNTDPGELYYLKMYPTTSSDVFVLRRYDGKWWALAAATVEQINLTPIQGKPSDSWRELNAHDDNGEVFYTNLRYPDRDPEYPPIEKVIYTATDATRRLVYLQRALNIARSVLYKVNPGAKIGLTTFANEVYTNQFYANTDSLQLESDIESIATQGGTRQDLGIQAGGQLLNTETDPSKKKAVILITDGAPNGTTWDAIYTQANLIKDRNIDIFTVGLSVQNVTGAVEGLMNTATEDYYFFDCRDGRGLVEAIESILETMFAKANMTGSVTDKIDPAFYPVDKDGNPLESGKEYEDENGHKYTVTKSGGSWTVNWKNQSFGWAYKDELGKNQPGWKGTVYVKAKENFLGGNVIKTNSDTDSDKLTVTGFEVLNDDGDVTNSGTLKDENGQDKSVDKILSTPYVNVDELALNEANIDWTVYLGTEVDPKQELEELLKKIDILKVVSGDTNEMITNKDQMLGGVSDQSKKMKLTDYLGIVNIDAFIDELITNGSKTYQYNNDFASAYGHGYVGDIVVSLVDTSGCYDKDNHATEAVGVDAKVTLKVEYKPRNNTIRNTELRITQADYHNGEGMPGLPVDIDDNLLKSNNTHIINVFAKSLQITKVDGVDLTKTLTGAEFKLYRTARNTDAVTDKKTVSGIDGEVFEVQTLDISSTTVATTDPLVKLNTDEKYYLVETKAPDGYNRLASPIEVNLDINDSYTPKPGTTPQDELPESGPYDWIETAMLTLGYPAKRTNDTGADIQNQGVTADSETATVYYKIPNDAGARLPATGGPGTTIFYAAGIAMIALSAFLLLRRKERDIL